MVGLICCYVPFLKLGFGFSTTNVYLELGRLAVHTLLFPIGIDDNLTFFFF